MQYHYGYMYYIYNICGLLFLARSPLRVPTPPLRMRISKVWKFVILSKVLSFLTLWDYEKLVLTMSRQTDHSFVCFSFILLKCRATTTNITANLPFAFLLHSQSRVHPVVVSAWYWNFIRLIFKCFSEYPFMSPELNLFLFYFFFLLLFKMTPFPSKIPPFLRMP